MHEIGDHVPHRERFVIPRENIPSKRRKQLTDQFMRRSHLVLKEFETAPNHHVKSDGLLGDGFGSTPEMCKENLIWVVTRMQVVVDRYPTWGDIVQVDTWVSAPGKSGMRRDWVLRDCKTGEILTRASRMWMD